MRSSLLAFTALLAGCASASSSGETGLPHIVFILADDMGYGDPGCYNPKSKTPTPNIDRLAKEGMRFTDAHAPAAVCVPSRYGLLTGRFPMRTKLPWRSRSVIAEGRTTVASLLRERGYVTSMVGKWHLGFDDGPGYDYSRPLAGGPMDRGFDSYFGIPHSLDIVPYYFIRGNRAESAPTEQIGASNSEGWSPIQGAFWRAGPIAPGYRHVDVLPRFTKESVRVIEGHDASKPLFFYLALPAPHTPWLPTPEFKGRGGAGMYGEFVAMVDDTVGQVLAALEKKGMAENTLVIFTSDNGPVWYARDTERFGHDSMGSLRGMKGDAWEAGHRMPFVVRWPGRVKPGSASEELINFTDVLATFAELTDRPLREGEGPDSVSFLPALLGRVSARAAGEGTIFQSARGFLAIRRGSWKLIDQRGSGGFSQPRKVKPKPGEPKGQLYNLADDPGETRNLYGARPKVTGELTALLKRYRERTWSRR